jgi:DNA-binding protein
MPEKQELEMGATEDEGMAQGNTVYIGKKPTMNYVLAVVTQFNSGAQTVRIKARGNAISRAVDVAEIVRGRFLRELSAPSNEYIRIGSEELQNEDGTSSKVSYIQITAKNHEADGDGKTDEDGTVYIGKKPAMNYVLAVITQMNGGRPHVAIKARGNAISKAVDVLEITRNRFMKDIRDPSNDAISVRSEELSNEDGTVSRVSSMEILLHK